MTIASSVPTISSLIQCDSVARRINFRAGRLRRKYGLAREEERDLRQQFWMALTRAMRRFDPGRCPLDRFVLMVLNRYYKYRVRQLSKAQESEVAGAMSFEDVGCAATVLVRDPSAEVAIGQADLRQDVAGVLKELSDKDRRICLAVMTCNSPNAAARQLRMSHSTVYRTMRRLRDLFIERGLCPPGFDGECSTSARPAKEQE
ncbi:MAG: sigma-70 family RNA polymerase sigma factor [Phycisphaeraceae bacterium]|nr:sigma-70 family RNA polymerase sigma factor [Phycisphaeraceae bacterium]